MGHGSNGHKHISLRIEGDLWREMFAEYKRWRGMDLDKSFSRWMRHVIREKLGHERRRRRPLRDPQPTLEYLSRNAQVMDEFRNIMFHFDNFIVLTYRGDFYVAERHFRYLSD